jgi:threonine dehydrogenase-like Zn-dependent dehydrogenase
MRALCWHGKEDIRVERVPDPRIINPRDIIVGVSSTAICGSDLHLYHGLMPSMQPGDIIGHEFMGEVVEVGPEIRNLRVGDRVVVPATLSCGHCSYCAKSQHSLCDNTNPNGWMGELAYGHGGAAVFGFSHMFGGYAGGQAEYVRVPFGDAGPLEVPRHLSDEQVLLLSDVFPTGYQGALQCRIQPGDVVAVWGAGPVGLFAMVSAYLLGAERVIGIDRFPERLRLAEHGAGAEVINYERVDVRDALNEMTGGRGPDACIDAVGMEAHGSGLAGTYDALKHRMHLQTDRPTALRECIQACRKGGVVSIPGAYGGVVDKFPLGAVFAKSLTLAAGVTHIQAHMASLLARILDAEADPTFVITHRARLQEGPEMYRLYADKREGCIKAVLKP